MLTFEKFYLFAFLFSPPLDCVLAMVLQELFLRYFVPAGDFEWIIFKWQKFFVIFMLIILNQYLIKISSQKWNDFVFFFSKYLLWIGSFYKKFLMFKVSVGLAPVELLNSPLLVSINVFAHFCRWMSSYLREINTCQIILKFWIKDKCQQHDYSFLLPRMFDFHPVGSKKVDVR